MTQAEAMRQQVLFRGNVYYKKLHHKIRASFSPYSQSDFQLGQAIQRSLFYKRLKI